ncbi:MAG TPA: pitrilysin family protein [Candidatus Acidoferrum sp.]|nr:pitrilysin family protein [Candidatus Acidoferrum sp.]
MTRVLGAVLLVLAIAGLADAQSVTQERLDNGLLVLVRENPLAPVVAISLMVEMGTRWESPDNAGISNFVHAVMVKGTTKRGGGAMAEAVALLGGKISAAGDVDYSEVKTDGLARFWRELLGLTAELALSPALKREEIDNERDLLLSRVQKRRDSPNNRAFDELYAALYGPHPYALSILGTAESLKRIDHAAIVAWYRRFYRPERMRLAVSGQVKASEVMAEARKLFGTLAGGGRVDDPPIAPPTATGRRITIEQPAQQAQILVAGLAPRLSDRDHAAVKVLATVLGGGMAGRLFSELRDKQALAYTASAYYDPVREPGALILYLGTAPENTTRAEEALRKEIERIRSEPLGADELGRAKGYLLGNYMMDRRTNSRLAWYLAFYETEGIGQKFPDQYRKAVEAVTAADVLRVARTYLAHPTTVVLAPK